MSLFNKIFGKDIDCYNYITSKAIDIGFKKRRDIVGDDVAGNMSYYFDVYYIKVYFNKYKSYIKIQKYDRGTDTHFTIFKYFFDSNNVINYTDIIDKFFYRISDINNIKINLRHKKIDEIRHRICNT